MSIEKKAIDRAVLMLNIAAKHCEQFAGEESTHYDEADRDGGCVADDSREAASELKYQATRESETPKPVDILPVSLMDGARAMHNYAYTNDLSERDGFIQEEYLDNAKACAEAWGLKWK